MYPEDRTEIIEDPRAGLQDALYELKRVIVGQDAMLERLLVALLAGGHVLLEGVPGLAKTLTVKTLADVLGGQFRRVQFTPDLVPSDLVGTRIYRPDTGRFDTELGPVFGNFLLADEINRAPAKVQSALLEVMQERQVTIAGETYPLPKPFLVLATQNPIESEGTYPLPEAQVDRFLFKLIVDYPTVGEEAAVVGRAIGKPAEVRERVPIGALERYRRDRPRRLRRPRRDRLRRRADRRHPPPRQVRAARARGPDRVRLRARVARSAWSRPPRRSRCCAAATTPWPRTSPTSPSDVLRHRLVLTYDALGDGVRPTTCSTASSTPSAASARPSARSRSRMRPRPASGEDDLAHTGDPRGGP